jgi:protein-tyrosine phosphatase
MSFFVIEKKYLKKFFFIQKSITFDLSKAMKQSNKPYQNEKFLYVTYRRGLYYCRHHPSNQDFRWLNLNINNRFNYRKLMKTIKAQFKDQAGYYTMIFTFNQELWTIKDIIAHECKKENSQFIKFINYAN